MLIPNVSEMSENVNVNDLNVNVNVESLQETLNLRLRANVFVDYQSAEESLKVSLWEHLNEICKIKHTVSNTYHPIDYILTSKLNEKKLYLELKSRSAEHERFSEFLIGSSKLKNIQKNNLVPCILIWSFNKPNKRYLEFSESNNIYFIQYTTEMLKLPVKQLNGSGVVYIPKNDCDTSFERLIIFIKNYFDCEC